MAKTIKGLEKEEKKVFQKLQDIAEIDKMSVGQRDKFLKALNEYLEVNVELSIAVDKEL